MSQRACCLLDEGCMTLGGRAVGEQCCESLLWPVNQEELIVPTALVTGGASGIGVEAVRLLAKSYDVIVADVDADLGEQAAKEVGGRFLHLDVGNSEAWRQVPDVEVAVLNAGVLSGATPCTPDSWTDGLWSSVRSVNIDGAVLGLRAVLPAMLERNEGSVVLTASLSGLSPLPADPLYSASKHFIVGLMRSVALQLRQSQVRVMALCPGATDTPILSSSQRSTLTLLSPKDVAVALVELLERGQSGTALVVTVSGAAYPWSFTDVPAVSRPGAELQVNT